MSWLYRQLVRPVLFAEDPEQIHERTIHALGWISRRAVLCEAVSTFFETPNLPVERFGLHFPNPIGLAAGMDKNAEALPAWHALGFGFTELGAVTWHPQPGNPQPRVFRAIPDEAIINRMGFNNLGAVKVAEILSECRQRGLWPRHPVGMNLGKSKVTPLDRAAEDYANSLRVLLPFIDFFVVNVSSPNTPNLRQLQDKTALDEILAALQEVTAGGVHKPLLVKVAPDLTFEALDDIVDITERRKLAGLVATNTTVTRPDQVAPALQKIYRETGGLSGRPIKSRSTEIIRHLHRQTSGRVPIIGVGGIFTAEDAWEKIIAGASLLQVYTGMVYEGPWIVPAIVNGLLERLRQAGLRGLEDAIGCEQKQVCSPATGALAHAVH
jgi:dihydroorotate dehydrogenase